MTSKHIQVWVLYWLHGLIANLLTYRNVVICSIEPACNRTVLNDEVRLQTRQESGYDVTIPVWTAPLEINKCQQPSLSDPAEQTTVTLQDE